MQSPSSREEQQSTRLLKFLSVLLAFLVLAPSGRQDPAQSRRVAPGVEYERYVLPGPFRVDVLRIDLLTPSLAIESFRPDTLVPVSLQVRRRQIAGGVILAAVNADFFSFKTSRPVGNQVVNGVFVSGISSRRSHLGIVGRRRPMMAPLSFSGKWFIHGRMASLAGINRGRRAGETVLYNSYWGTNTGPDSGGIKAVLALADSRWRVMDTVVTVVRALVEDRVAEIPEDGAVLAYSQSEKGVGCMVGDTVKLLLGFAGSTSRFSQVVGGAGRILRNGRVAIEEDTVAEGLKPAFLTARHPRTFVGINRDTTVMVLCTVDGRQTSSVGMNFQEMSEFLLKIDAWDAINLDGGGSTTMVVNGGVVNTPSDSTGERGVANSVQLLLRTDDN